MNHICIVIPVYNEGTYLESFLRKLIKTVSCIPNIFRIIVVNDGSKDETSQILAKYTNSQQFIVIQHKKNKGKGAAMKSGLLRAIKEDAQAVIFMDSDGQHDPGYLPAFIDHLQQYPLVFGYRHLAKDAPYIRRKGNEAARFIFRNVFNIQRKDLLCGFMAMRSDIFDVMNWHSTDYGVEAEISAIVAKYNISFKEILISTIYYDTNKGVNLIDAFFILLKIPYWYLKY